VVVKIVNEGSHPYLYNSTGYEACNLTYRDQTGREFIILPGTHCDLVLMEDIMPSETVTLFGPAIGKSGSRAAMSPTPRCVGAYGARRSRAAARDIGTTGIISWGACPRVRRDGVRAPSD
jgi:hypothetical protein